MDNFNFEYTKDARVVMLLAERIAIESGSEVITPDHLLLGLLRNPDGGAVQTLRILGIPIASLRSQLEEHIIPSPTPLPENQPVKFSDETRSVMREAVSAAESRRLKYIDTSLILIGIMLNALLPASALLRQNGVRLENFKSNLRPESPEGSTPPPSPSQRPGLSMSSPQAAPKKRQLAGRLPVNVSPVFIGIVLFTILVGALMFLAIIPPGIGVFLFVAGGWLISLCLHEFGHALVAYLNGDLSVVSQGYLTLNPLRYTHWTMSILMPMLFVIAGGIALPGGAVYVNLMAIPSPRQRSLVSASGPLMNLGFLLLLAIPLALGRSGLISGGTSEFWAGISLLAFFQVVALVLNLLPIPGLDGFGIIAPFLPEDVQYAALTFGRFGYLLLFALLWIESPISNAFWNIITQLGNLFGVNSYLVSLGLSLFRFWT